MKFCILFKLSPCPRYCLLIGSQLTTWSQGNLHYIRLHFFQLNREFFCLLPSLARLYSAAASPSERLRSYGSLAMNINKLLKHFTLIVFWYERRNLLCSHTSVDIFTSVHDCQRAIRAKTLGWRGGSRIEPRKTGQKAEKFSIELKKV